MPMRAQKVIVKKVRINRGDSYRPLTVVGPDCVTAQKLGFCGSQLAPTKVRASHFIAALAVVFL
jgi:hypothetical protein